MELNKRIKKAKNIKKKQINHVLIPPYAPCANSTSKSIKETISKVLKINKGGDWV